MAWSVNKRLNHLVTSLKEMAAGARMAQRARDYWGARKMDNLLGAWKLDGKGRYSGTGLKPGDVDALKSLVIDLAKLADANQALLRGIEEYDRGQPPDNWDEE